MEAAYILVFPLIEAGAYVALIAAGIARQQAPIVVIGAAGLVWWLVRQRGFGWLKRRKR